MDLEAVPGRGGDERPPAAVLLHAAPEERGAREHLAELALLEREADVVDPGHLPVPRLDDDVDRAALELGEPKPEADPVELLPRRPRLVRRGLLAEAAVTGDEREAELGEIALLDLPHLARDQVVVEEVHGLRPDSTEELSSPR